MSSRLQTLLPLVSAMILAFGGGVMVAEYKLPPYRTISNGAKTIYYSVAALTAPPYIGQFSVPEPDVAPGDAPAARFTDLGGAATGPGTILVHGGLNEYRELCPEAGCLAVEIDRSGAVLRHWPFRPAEILAADMTNGSLYREAVPGVPAAVFRPLGVQLYDNGDILVSFQSTGAMFPFAAGIARIAPDGSPVWYRFDYSHHWVTLLDDGTALVPDLDVADAAMQVPVGPRGRLEYLACDTGRPQIDGVQHIGPDGEVLRRYDVAAALLDSNWSAILAATSDPCDPLHINYVDVLDDSAPGGALAPGHLVLSLRNVSAVVVLDPDTGAVTHVTRGGFAEQHSVHHLTGGTVLMFDNWGGDAMGTGSRLLEVDLETGAERRIFPLPGDDAFPLFSHRGSHLDISADKARALVSFSGEGAGWEVDLGSGAALWRYDNLHDLTGLSGAPDEMQGVAVRSNLYGLTYVDGPEASAE